VGSWNPAHCSRIDEAEQAVLLYFDEWLDHPRLEHAALPSEEQQSDNPSLVADDGCTKEM